ncbi:MAG TPA: oligosaccharide flippase family protein [Chloroflexota bacterium]
MRLGTLSGHTVSTLGSQVATVLIGLAINILLARQVGAEYQGQYVIALTVYGVGTLVLGSGIPNYNRATIARMHGKTGHVFVNTLAMSGLGALVLWPLVIVASRFAPIDGGSSWALFYPAVALVPVGVLAEACVAIIHGFGRVPAMNALRLAPWLVQVSVMGLLAAGSMLDIRNTVAVWVLTRVGATVVTLLLAARLSGVASSVDRALLRTMWAFGLRAWFARLIGTANQRIDLLVLGALAAPATVGQYGVATSMAELLYYVPAALGTALLPRIAQNLDRASELSSRGCRLVILLSLPSMAAVALAGPVAIRLAFGIQYQPAEQALWLLVPGVAVYSVAHVTSGYFDAIGRPGVNAIVATSSLVIEAALLVGLVPLFGLIGAAVACSAGYAAGAVTNTFMFARISGASTREIFAPRGAEIRRLLQRTA